MLKATISLSFIDELQRQNSSVTEPAKTAGVVFCHPLLLLQLILLFFVHHVISNRHIIQSGLIKVNNYVILVDCCPYR